MTFRPKPEHVFHQATADIVGFRRKLRCPLIIQLAAALWIVYGLSLLIDGALATMLVGLTLFPIIRFLMALILVGIAITVLRGDAHGVRGYGWLSVILGWAQLLFLLIVLRQNEQQRPALLNYTSAIVPLALIVAGVLALAGSRRYVDWRKKRGFTKA